MSMRSSFIYGFGFYSKCDEGKLIDFIKKHKETFCKKDMEKETYNKIISSASNKYALDYLEDIFENYSCDNTGMEGIGAVISNIMSRETGIRFSYCSPDDGCNTPASVLFEKDYPWLLNETECNLTEEVLHNIIKKYMEELGINEEPDYLNLEYYK